LIKENEFLFFLFEKKKIPKKKNQRKNNLVNVICPTLVILTSCQRVFQTKERSENTKEKKVIALYG